MIFFTSPKNEGKISGLVTAPCLYWRVPTEQTLCEKTCVSSIKHLLFEWSLVEQSVWGAEVSLLRRECFHFSQRRSSDVTLDGCQIKELVYGDINMVKLMITVSSGSYQRARWAAVTEELLYKSDCRRAPTFTLRCSSCVQTQREEQFLLRSILNLCLRSAEICVSDQTSSFCCWTFVGCFHVD